MELTKEATIIRVIIVRVRCLECRMWMAEEDESAHICNDCSAGDGEE